VQALVPNCRRMLPTEGPFFPVTKGRSDNSRVRRDTRIFELESISRKLNITVMDSFGMPSHRRGRPLRPASVRRLPMARASCKSLRYADYSHLEYSRITKDTAVQALLWLVGSNQRLGVLHVQRLPEIYRGLRSNLSSSIGPDSEVK
jgi:hypothetical protein